MKQTQEDAEAAAEEAAGVFPAVAQPPTDRSVVRGPSEAVTDRPVAAIAVTTDRPVAAIAVTTVRTVVAIAVTTVRTDMMTVRIIDRTDTRTAKTSVRMSTMIAAGIDEDGGWGRP